MITRRSVLGAAALGGAWLVAGATRASASPASIADELSRFVTEQAGKGLFSGTVRLEHRGRTLLCAAHGMADRAAGLRNTAGTRFTVASVGKFYTAVAAARLVQEGRLRFDTTFGEAVPQLRNPALRPLTLHQMLTHTAALPEVDHTLYTGRRAVDNLPLLEELELIGTPGQRWRYSNAGFMAAAIMIELAGRRRFDVAMRTQVFVPARMRDSLAPVGVRSAVRYLPSGEAVPPDNPQGSGGFYSSVGDLVGFADALMGHRLLDERHTTEVTTGKVPTAFDDRYAYGCSEMFPAGHRIVWHNGGAPGANAWLQIYPDDGYTLAALSNVYAFRAPGGVEPIVRTAQRLITGG